MEGRRVAKFYSKNRNFILKLSYLALLVYTMLSNNRSTAGKTKEVKRRESKSSKLYSKYLTKESLKTLMRNISSKSVYQNLALELILLVTRALLTLKVASLDGLIVSSLINTRYRSFFKKLGFWMLLGLPAALVNSSLTLTEELLSRNIRVNLTKNLLEDYLPEDDKSTLYKLVNKLQINDPNQRITSDVERFSNSLASLPSQILKPALDLLLCANQLSSKGSNSAEGVLFLGLITHFSTILLKNFTPNFIRLSSKSNELENKFHMTHSKIIDNSEEIALIKGHKRELDIVDMNYFELESFKRLEFRRLAIYDFTMSFIVKYFWGASGLILCSIPVFTANDVDKGSISSTFITNRRLLLSASNSLGRLIQSRKNIQNLMGYTSKIVEFHSHLLELNQEEELELENNPTSEMSLFSSYMSKSSSGQSRENLPLITGPNVLYGDEITFDKIPLITPMGNLLVEELSFSIKPGDNLLIIGPNGCGKSSLFRVLGGLWKVNDPGKLTIPFSRKDLFYLPQRAFLTIGTLKEQIIYPDSLEEYLHNDKSDSHLIELLKIVKLDHLIVENEKIIKGISQDDHFQIEEVGNPLNLTRKWPEVLSIGEQQRLALARLYYHQPKFAVLDECTSSISQELEQECYRYAIEKLNITVLSVCHRTTLWKFHQYLLKFDGHGQTKFNRFDPIQRLKYHDEKFDIDKKVKELSTIEKRLQDLKKIQKDQKRYNSQIMLKSQ